MSALTSLLVRDRVVPVKKIEEAISRQVISGGELDTVLLEVQAAPENVIASYRAAEFGMDAVDRDALMSVSRDVIKVVPREVAEEHRIVPVALGEHIGLAVGAPLPAETEQQLSFLLGARIEQRLACNARIEAALAEHYAVELTSRTRRLVKKLAKREAGAISHVEPLDDNRRTIVDAPDLEVGVSGVSVEPRASGTPSAPSGTSKYGARVSGVPDEPEASTTQGVVGPSNAVDDVEAPEPASGETRKGAQVADAPERTSHPVPVNTARSIEASDEVKRQSLGAKPVQPSFSASSAASSASDSGPSNREGDAEPSKRSAKASQSSLAVRPPPHPLVKKVRGPFTAKIAVELLEQAEDRDDILQISFAFIRQFFDCAALFVVHDDVAEGLDVHGGDLDYADVRRITQSVTAPGALADAYRLAMPRVALLDAGTAEDRALGTALGRTRQQPSVLAPVAIRQRVVLMFYGDQGGDDFGIADVPEFVAFMPRVSEAFSQLILRRKLGRDKTEVPQEAPQRWHQAQKPWTEADRKPRKRTEAMDALGVPRSAPPPPNPVPRGAVTEPRDQPSPVGDGGEGGEGGESDGEPHRVSPAPEPPSGVVVGHGARTSDDAVASEGTQAAEDAESEKLPTPIELTRPKETRSTAGVYSMRGGVEYAGPAASRRPVTAEGPNRVTPGGRQRGSDTPPAQAEPEADPEPRPARPRDARVDPNPSQRPASAMPAPAAEPSRHRAQTLVDAVPAGAAIADPGMPSVIVTTDLRVERLIARLLKAAPDDEAVFAEVRAKGESVFPALLREFPGPLWFDRHAPHTRLPRAHDVSAIARVMESFGEVAVPYVGALLDREDADVRFYATLLAAELPHRDLVAPLGRRIFDIDPGTRALAMDVLRPMRRFGLEFNRVIDRVRANARIPSRPLPTRVAAVRAIGHLRDEGAVDLLLRLLHMKESRLVDAAHASLVLLTRQDFGKSPDAWADWAEEHRHEHRVEWLIDALMSDEVDVRLAASAELKQATQAYFGYHHESPKRERQRAQRKYRDWWESEGRSIFLD